MEKIPVLVIAGPTASGKTALAVELAEKYSGEVVSADSMQIYKRMDIGTAKPSKEEMRSVRHHMIDIVEPWENFSVADYVLRAHEIIKDISARGKLPIVAGGTGLYINSLIDGAEFLSEEKDSGVRERLNRIVEKKGVEPLVEKLKICDPQSAEKIHPNNVKRIIRAVEFFELTGKPISAKRNEPGGGRYNPLMIMIDYDRKLLYERIEKRVDAMFEKGLIEEVSGLVKMGLGKKNISMQGIGYKEVIDYLRGFTNREEMERIIKRDSRRYAKRQFTWFNRDKRMMKISGNLPERASEIIESRERWKEC